MDDKIKYAAALCLVVAIFALPFILNPNARYGGADVAGSDAVQKQSPGYEPWAKPIWQPPAETESMLFALQAAIGAIIIGYFIGYEKAKKDFGVSGDGEHKKDDGKRENEAGIEAGRHLHSHKKEGKE